MAPRFLLFFPVLAASTAFGCGAANEPSCPADDQKACPASSSLSYDDGIGALLTQRCSPCHAAGGVEATVILTDYSHVSGERMSIASQLVTCSMPPAGNPPLSADERKEILDWLSCGGPK
jgi:uncharacterized membrane protein